MSLILNIDTALETASICLAKEGICLDYAENKIQKEHSSWLHKAIDDMLIANEISIKQLSAVAVNIGPGSYTGLRVGLSAAKGICYALAIPLITINSLELIASSANADAADMICPCIDARRMEVYTAVYNKELQQIMPPNALILNTNSFAEILARNRIVFCGNATEKLKKFIKHTNTYFSVNTATAKNMAPYSVDMYVNNTFADLAATEPLYLKAFYISPEKNI